MSSEQIIRIRRSLQRRLSSICKAIERNEALIVQAMKAEEFLHTADLIKSVLHTVNKERSSRKECLSIMAFDWLLDGKKVVIEAPQGISAAKHMKDLYVLGHRLIRGRDKLFAHHKVLLIRKEEAQNILSRFDSGEEVLLPQKPISEKEHILQKPYRSYIASTGEKIFVGKDESSNHFITFHVAKGDDFWLHAEGIEGAHVIIRKKEGTVSPTALEEASLLAAYFSKGRKGGGIDGSTIPVIYAYRRDLYRKKGMAQGKVLVRTSKVLHPELNKERIEEILNRRI